MAMEFASLRHVVLGAVRPPTVAAAWSVLPSDELLHARGEAYAWSDRVVLRWLGAGVQRYWVYQKLAFLGQHSLQVFSWSVVITYLAYLSGES
jgi:hypothetical protein